MPKRDYDVAPVSERLDLDRVIKGLCSDLDQLRAGNISVSDAIARSLLAKQIFNGVRIYLSASKLLSENLPDVSLQENGTIDADSQQKEKINDGIPVHAGRRRRKGGDESPS